MGKIAVLLFFIVLTNSCQVFPLFNFDRYQVFEEPGGTPYRGNRNLAAVPRNVLIINNFFFTGLWGWVEDPWKIRGYIRNGNISIDFPDIDFEKVNTANLHSIDDVYVLSFHIECMDSWFRAQIGLYNNLRTNEPSGVLILYASDDLDRMTREGRVLLKAGWNFLSITANPDWISGTDMPSVIIRRISRDINDFLRQGYRWHIETFTGGN